MSGGPQEAAANWYPDPSNATQRRYWDGTAWTEHTAPASAPAHPPVQEPTPTAASDPNSVLGLVFVYGLLIGAVTGAASGTVAAPLIGTIIGAIVGAVVAVPVAFVAAVVLSRSVGSSRFRRRVDLTLLVLGVGTALLALGWISLRALVGPWPALTMLAVVVIGLVVVRPRLHRLG